MRAGRSRFQVFGLKLQITQRSRARADTAHARCFCLCRRKGRVELSCVLEASSCGVQREVTEGNTSWPSPPDKQRSKAARMDTDAASAGLRFPSRSILGAVLTGHADFGTQLGELLG
jgi:hypothetical protein